MLRNLEPSEEEPCLEAALKLPLHPPHHVFTSSLMETLVLLSRSLFSPANTHKRKDNTGLLSSVGDQTQFS